MRNCERAMIFALSAFALTGCTTIESTKIESTGAVQPGDNDGVAYFLPRQLVKVTATRTNSKLARAITTAARARSTSAKAEAALQEAEAVQTSAEDALARAEGSVAIALRQRQLNDAIAFVNVRRSEVASATSALDSAAKGLEDAAKDTDDRNFTVDVKMEILPPTADPRFGYRLNPNHSILRDDETTIEIASNGLLQSTNIIADDRTDDILVELGSIVGAGLGLTGDGSPRTFQDPQKGAEECLVKISSFEAIVDFGVEGHWTRLNDGLACIGVELELLEQETNWLVEPFRPVPHSASSNAINGIAYRTPVNIAIAVRKRARPDSTPERMHANDLADQRDTAQAALEAQDNQANRDALAAAETALTTALEAAKKSEETPVWVTSEIVSLSLPQAGPISVVPQDAGVFTRTEYDLAFDNGILTKYEGTRPSEALAIISTPLKVVDGVFSGLSRVISLRTGQAKSLAELSTAELELLNAQAALERGAITNERLLSAEELALANQLAAADVAQIANQTQLSQTRQALVTQLLTQQYAGQIAQLQQQEALLAANQRLSQSMFQAESSSITNQTQLLLNQLAFLNQEAALELAQTNLPTQLLEAQVAAELSRQIQAGIRECIEQRVDAEDLENVAECAR